MMIRAENGIVNQSQRLMAYFLLCVVRHFLWLYKTLLSFYLDLHLMQLNYCRVKQWMYVIKANAEIKLTITELRNVRSNAEKEFDSILKWWKWLTIMKQLFKSRGGANNKPTEKIMEESQKISTVILFS